MMTPSRGQKSSVFLFIVHRVTFVARPVNGSLRLGEVRAEAAALWCARRVMAGWSAREAPPLGAHSCARRRRHTRAQTFRADRHLFERAPTRAGQMEEPGHLADTFPSRRSHDHN